MLVPTWGQTTLMGNIEADGSVGTDFNNDLKGVHGMNEGEDQEIQASGQVRNHPTQKHLVPSPCDFSSAPFVIHVCE